MILIANCSAHPEFQMSNVKFFFCQPTWHNRVQPCDAEKRWCSSYHAYWTWKSARRPQSSPRRLQCWTQYCGWDMRGAWWAEIVSWNAALIPQLWTSQWKRSRQYKRRDIAGQDDFGWIRLNERQSADHRSTRRWLGRNLTLQAKARREVHGKEDKEDNKNPEPVKIITTKYFNSSVSNCWAWETTLFVLITLQILNLLNKTRALLESQKLTQTSKLKQASIEGFFKLWKSLECALKAVLKKPTNCTKW